MTQAGKKSKSRKRHNSSWACGSLQPGPHTALLLPRPRARGPARSDQAAPRSTGPRSRRRFPGMRPPRRPEGGLPSGLCRPGRPAEPEPPPGPRRASGAGGRRSAAPGRAGCPCLSGGGPGSSSLSPGRGVAKQRGHRPGRWRHLPMVAMAAAVAKVRECHLRSRGCMPGARAAGTAAGLAPRGGRGLRSGPPPPPQAPAPAPPAAGRCGIGRVARYIPGAPGLGPARPRRRRSARPPASPSDPQSLRPATVLHLRNAPKNKPLVAQLAPLSVTHAGPHQSQAAAGPSHRPHPPHQPITRRKSSAPAVPPQLSPNTLTLSGQLIISTTR